MQEISILASRALAAQKQFTAVADNIANANSHGYRKLQMDFREVVSRPSGAATASYVADRGITVSHEAGTFEQTGNPLDVAIGGDGYFAVEVNGNIHYTRRGQFLVNTEGTLVTPEGNPVLDNANAQIQFPQGVKDIHIAPDGTVSTEQGQLAQLGIFNFSPEDEKTLVRTGDTSFASAGGASPFPVEAPSVRQGYLETSNVNAVQEMVTMQTVSRAYENTLGLLSSMNELETRAIRNLGGTQ